jgi:ribonuclease I
MTSKSHYSAHQSAYFAHQLTLRAASDSMDSMAGALLDAQVDLNPHQIDAALFATSNPLSKGVILADEVGASCRRMQLFEIFE